MGGARCAVVASVGARVGVALVVVVAVALAVAEVGFVGTVSADAPAPAAPPASALEDVAAHRTPDGLRIEAAAVGLPDWRFPTLDARCRSARSAALRRAVESLHGYLDRALRATRVTPSRLAAAHATIDETVRVMSTEGLVDCGAVATVSVSVSALELALEGEEVGWP